MTIFTKLVTKLLKKRNPPQTLLDLSLRPLLHPLPYSSSFPHHSTHCYTTATLFPSHVSSFSSSRTQFFQLHQFESNEAACVDGVVEMLWKTKHFSSETEAIAFIDTSTDVRLSGDLVYSIIWAFRHEWELALLTFRWGQKWGCSNSRACDLMIWILGQQMRFGTAWRLIREMLLSSMDVRLGLLILIESYAVANCPRKSIQTFQAMEKFKIRQDSEALYTLLDVLCKNGNVEEAEEFMQLNKNLFPLQTESFNLILNGWCNISLDLIEAKRVWREMSNCCITPDATSYTHMISCFSKVGNLFSSLRMYDEMKKRGWVPGLDVYNSLIYVLTRDNCLKEALSLVDKIKEAGLQPLSSTYNSMIFPLCEAHKLEDAKSVLIGMVRVGLNPTTETYHAFVEMESADGIVELLKQMREAGCGPYSHTFVLIISKLLESKQPGDALRMWLEMLKYEVVPDSAHYSVMVRGLVVCGWPAKARKFYDDMKLKGFPDNPTINKLFQEPVGGDGEHGKQRTRHREKKCTGEKESLGICLNGTRSKSW